MRRSVGSGLVCWVLLGMSSGCGGGATPAALPARPEAPAARPAEAPSVQERLLAAMHEVERPADVLGALPPPLRGDLDALLERTDPRTRIELQQLRGRDAAQHALLHVAAGGQAREALYALAAGASAEQLLLVHLGLDRRSTLDDVVQAVPALARAAAARFVHDSVLAVTDARTFTAELCERIARAALTLDEPRLRLLSLRAAAELEPSATRRLAVAEEAARQLDLDLAEAALAAADELLGEAGGGSRRRAAGAMVEAAREVQARRGRDLDLEGRLQQAGALLLLERHGDAREVLGPVRARAPEHLGLAAALALAELGGTICPGMPAGTGSAPVCARAWKRQPEVPALLDRLQQAWQAGAGRDERAIETYLGLVHVVPWIHQMVEQREVDEGSFRARLDAVQRAAREAAQTSPRLAGLVLFVDGLVAGVEAAQQRQGGERVRLVPAVQARLWKRAVALPIDPAGGRADRHAQSAVLAVAAYAMQERDVLPLVQRLPEGEALDEPYRRTRALLRIWCAIARGRQDVAEQARRELFALLPPAEPPPGAGGAFERARTVLTLAELDVAMARDPKALAVLERVARPLLADDVPPLLRLRAGLDLAGVLARDGRCAEARGVLATVIGSQQIGDEPSPWRDLLVVAKSYWLVLQARDASGDQRERHLADLAEIDEHSRTGGVPASIELWRRMWKKELAYLAAADRCAGARGCVARAARERRLTDAQIDRAVGAEAGRLIRAGVLSAGTVQASFEFSGRSGLRPVIALDPRFLAVEIPPR